MKAVLAIVAILGIVYALAFFGILPAQKMADKNPALAHVLTTLHLAKVKKPIKGTLAATAPSPEQQALEAGKKKLAADQAQLAKDRVAFETEQQQAAAPAPAAAPSTPNNSASSAKLSAIYATMSADDISHILGKLPDPDVIQALTQLDEKKAGQVLAILPVDRAARLSRLMTHPVPQMQAAL
jgi:flagellar motility protein MotE (MotC chaperone)